MDNTAKLNKIENLYYSHKINFDFSNSLFKFTIHDETLKAYVKSYLDNDDLELKKLALYIIFSSDLKDKSLLFSLFKTVFLFKDDIEILKKYLIFLQGFHSEELEDFLYILATDLEEKELSFFIDILQDRYNMTGITLSFFLLETYKLTEQDTIKIYKYFF